MHALDYSIIALYLLLVFGVAFGFARRASRSATDYVVADRKLPWWVIGVSNVASSDGADAFWILVIMSGAFVGLYRFWWISAVFMLPLAVLWARYWRRLALTSPGELYEVRYSGVAAARFRSVFVIYGALITSGIVLGYVLQGCSQILAPFLDWSADTTLIVVCLASMSYTMAAGLLGVAYSDVPQFIFVMVGRVLLAVVVLKLAGGLGTVLDSVEAIRGPGFLQPYPPSDAAMFGKWKVESGTLVALILAGLLQISGTRSAAVQRALAARSETDAALGQMLNAVLTLVVRIVPLVLIGFAAIVLLPSDIKPGDAWTYLVQQHAGPGLFGLLLVGLVAGYMSTVDTYLNFMTAGLYNDVYLRHINPEASPRRQLWFCRITTVVVTGMAFLWAKVLVGTIDADWLNFINSVLGLFILPLAVLRWMWWRLNIWGEIAAFALGVPLAYVVWFTLGFKDQPYWQSFLVLVGAGWGLILAVTFATKPERRETLEAFYAKVRPPGFWGPIAAAMPKEIQEQARAERRRDGLTALAGLGFCASIVVGVSAAFARDPIVFPCIVIAVSSGIAFARTQRRLT